MQETTPDATRLKSIFDPCRQCGACCKQYRRIRLHPDEVTFIQRMGGHVGVDVTLAELREKSLDQLMAEAREKDELYMVHPDDKGCIFLEKRNNIYHCKIYHYRPRTCRGFHCNLADNSFLNMLGRNAIHLLGQNSFGLPLEKG